MPLSITELCSSLPRLIDQCVCTHHCYTSTACWWISQRDEALDCEERTGTPRGVGGVPNKFTGRGHLQDVFVTRRKPTDLMQHRTRPGCSVH